jgi:hypothetical protein
VEQSRDCGDGAAVSLQSSNPTAARRPDKAVRDQDADQSAAAALVRVLFPRYANQLECARPSFRPAEIAGRTYSLRHDDRLLHIDAFPARPTHGRRILRVFSNVAADGAVRVWLIGERFEDFARAFCPRVRPPLPGSALIHEVFGLTKGRRTAYDHIMLGLHDAGKLDTAFQASSPRVTVSFPSGSTWICFTDQVLHAAISGHRALEQTFHLPVAAMARPELSPLRVLEHIAGRPLAAASQPRRRRVAVAMLYFAYHAF